MRKIIEQQGASTSGEPSTGAGPSREVNDLRLSAVDHLPMAESPGAEPQPGIILLTP